MTHSTVWQAGVAEEAREATASSMNFEMYMLRIGPRRTCLQSVTVPRQPAELVGLPPRGGAS